MSEIVREREKRYIFEEYLLVLERGYFWLGFMIEGFVGSFYSVVDIFDIFFSNVGNYLFVFWVDGWECFF